MMKYPLQIEIENDLTESFNDVNDALAANDPALLVIARHYINAIKRIQTICENRKRF